MILIIPEDFKSFDGAVQKILADRESYVLKFGYFIRSVGFPILYMMPTATFCL